MKNSSTSNTLSWIILWRWLMPVFLVMQWLLTSGHIVSDRGNASFILAYRWWQLENVCAEMKWNHITQLGQLWSVIMKWKPEHCAAVFSNNRIRYLQNWSCLETEACSFFLVFSCHFMHCHNFLCADECNFESMSTDLIFVSVITLEAFVMCRVFRCANVFWVCFPLRSSGILWEKVVKKKGSPESWNAAAVRLDQDLEYQADWRAGILQGPCSDN